MSKTDKRSLRQKVLPSPSPSRHHARNRVSPLPQATSRVLPMRSGMPGALRP